MPHHEEGEQVDELLEEVVGLEVDLVIRVGSQGSNQGNGMNQNGDAINDNIWGDVRNVIENNDYGIVLMREEFCPSNEMQKLETELWNHTIVGAGHAAYTDRFHELASECGQSKEALRRKKWGRTNKVRIGRDGYRGLGLEMLLLQSQTLLGENIRGRRNNGNQAHGRALMLGAEEA
ncbi:hypothetical protein Tco_0983245 [Tanacetum coccineum]